MEYLVKTEAHISAIEVSIFDHEHSTVKPVLKEIAPIHYQSTYAQDVLLCFKD